MNSTEEDFVDAEEGPKKGAGDGDGMFIIFELTSLLIEEALQEPVVNGVAAEEDRTEDQVCPDFLQLKQSCLKH